MRKKTLLVTGILLILSTLSGCAFFDNEARDKAACDKLSEIITNQESDDILSEATSSFLLRVEQEVLPLASGSLGSDVRDLLDSYEGTQSGSIFDQFAGGVDSIYYADLVLARCFEVSSSIDN